MAFRRFLRGQVEWDRLESVMREVARRYDQTDLRVEFLDADNWLSTPCVVNDRWFVKVMTPQHSLLHAVLTTGRNLGAFSSGQEGFFEHVADPVEMADRELEATRRMRSLGINVPEPVEAFEHDGLGVLVVEYLPAFRTLGALDHREVVRYAPDLFDALARLHAAGLAHGDLRAENVLVARDCLYLIDATSVREGAIEQARAYDLACALAALEPLVGPKTALDAAREHYPTEHLLAAEDFLDFVNMRPDHDFDAASVKGEIEKQATAEGAEG
ncbi:RIO1 family regulatory kinase/ATPase [Halomarina rubra]|uniref:non-specific serine/threonine protein kinase n=1 Tax=Halomarina rubra TaxID=2071873 RepID=A0ABD6ARL7_9EURY|nr:RIO1 family regulatory kinase/ATPase [Halomarina rubra]